MITSMKQEHSKEPYMYQILVFDYTATLQK